MLKGIVTGTLVGAVAMAAVLKWRDARAEAGAEKAAGVAGQADDLAKLRADADKLKADRAALEAEIAEEDKRLASVDPVKTGTGKKKKAKKGPPTWKEIAPKLIAMISPKMREGKEAMTDEEREKLQEAAQMAMLSMMALLGDIAKNRGIGLEDAMFAPEGLPELMLATLQGSEHPPTPEQEKALRELMATYADGYKAEGGDDKSKLEMKMARQDSADAFMDSFKAGLSPEQIALTDTARMFGDFNLGGGGGMYSTSGSHEDVVRGLTDDWVKSMRFDPAQGSTVSPIVEEYMRSVDSIRATAPPANMSDVEATKFYADQKRKTTMAQIEAQRKLSQMATTPEQKKAIRDWTRQYNYHVGSTTSPDPMEIPEATEDDK